MKMRFVRLLLIVILSSFLFCACKAQPSNPSKNSIIGTWQNTEFGTFIFNDDGTISGIALVRYAAAEGTEEPEPEPYDIKGTYSCTDDRLTMQYALLSDGQSEVELDMACQFEITNNGNILKLTDDEGVI
jgi:hypothetical protein